MAFLDDIGKKIGMAGQTAAQKAMVMTDVARINADIAEEEKKIEHNYLQIGKLYVSLHTDVWEKEFDGMIAAIQESELKIKSYQERVQDIRGVVRCEKCGAEVANTAAFCNSCGTAMPRKIKVISQEYMKKCVKCGARLGEDDRFCTFCGTPFVMEERVVVEPLEQSMVERPTAQSMAERPLEQSVAEQPLAYRQEQAEEETQMLMPEEQNVAAERMEENTMRVCANCHAYVEPDMLFCTECGQRLN